MFWAQVAVCFSLFTGVDADLSVAVEATAEKTLDTLSGQTAFVFTELSDQGPRLLYGIRAQERFAVGSSFKLFIFGTLVDEVNVGRRRLDDAMLLRRDKVGPPHGEMADWPAGSPVTLYTLALKMISVSDNTATDHLHYLLGRERIERQMQTMGHGDAAINRPLLSTREMAMLRDKNQGIPAARYQKLDECARRKFLDEHYGAAPDYAQFDFDTSAYSLAEWYASPVEMARALAWIQHNTTTDNPAYSMRAILAVDPKLKVDPAVWPFVGFKGGSEDQLLAGNWLLQHRGGKWYTFHVFCNSPTEQVTPARMLPAIERIFAAIESTLAKTPDDR
jgi:beta-lactamase class A